MRASARLIRPRYGFEGYLNCALGRVQSGLRRLRPRRSLSAERSTLPFLHPWTFVTSHARVLICLASRPGITLREVAAEAGITERAAQRVVAELEAAGYLTRHRLGTRNFYELHAERPLRDPMLSGWSVGDLLATFVRPGHRRAEALAAPADRDAFGLTRK